MDPSIYWGKWSYLKVVFKFCFSSENWIFLNKMRLSLFIIKTSQVIIFFLHKLYKCLPIKLLLLSSPRLFLSTPEAVEETPTKIKNNPRPITLKIFLPKYSLPSNTKPIMASSGYKLFFQLPLLKFK